MSKARNANMFFRSGGLMSFLLHHLPAVLYMGLIFLVSSFPSINPPKLGFTWDDKIYHFGEFALLSALLYTALRYYRGVWAQKYGHLLAILIACLFAISDEIHQAYVPGRDSTVSDFVADALGAIAAQVLIFIYLKSRQKSVD